MSAGPQIHKLFLKEWNSSVVRKIKYLEYSCEERFWVCEKQAGDNHMNIHCPSCVDLCFCVFQIHISKINPSTKFSGVYERKHIVFKPGRSQDLFFFFCNSTWCFLS